MPLSGMMVSPTNLQRILLRRGQIEPTGAAAPSGRAAGGRRRYSAFGTGIWRSPTRSRYSTHPSRRNVR